MVSVLNNYGGFYSRKVYVNEARRAGAAINLPCVNNSIYVTTIYGSDIYLGFDCLQNLEAKLANRIVEERMTNGEYTGLENLVLRTGASLEQVLILIRVGAFRFLEIGKKELLWEAHMVLSKDVKQDKGPVLFSSMSRKPVLPELESCIVEDYYDEIELIGFTVSGTLFDLARSPYRGDVGAEALLQHEGRVLRLVGDFVAEKYVKTKRGELMKFGTFFDENGVFFDTVHFPQSLAQYPLRGAGLYLIEGKVVVEFGCPSIDVIRCAKMPLQVDPRSE
jgi:DNA polymerase III alpha subunit